MSQKPTLGADSPQTSHFDLSKIITVKHSPDPSTYSSYAISLVSLPACAILAPITGATPSTKAYSTVQTTRDMHVELNSDLLYTNHSCAPSVEFDVSEMVVRVARDRDLKVGDRVTFWYPSTEWSMARGFWCDCGSEGCKGWIAGAGEMDEEVVRGYWLNRHILEMLDERKKGGSHGEA